MEQLKPCQLVAAGGDAGKGGVRRVNYCFVRFEHWRAADNACRESDRAINGMVSHSCTALGLYALSKIFIWIRRFCFQTHRKDFHK